MPEDVEENTEGGKKNEVLPLYYLKRQEPASELFRLLDIVAWTSPIQTLMGLPSSRNGVDVDWLSWREKTEEESCFLSGKASLRVQTKNDCLKDLWGKSIAKSVFIVVSYDSWVLQFSFVKSVLKGCEACSS